MLKWFVTRRQTQTRTNNFIDDSSLQISLTAIIFFSELVSFRNIHSAVESYQNIFNCSETKNVNIFIHVKEDMCLEQTIFKTTTCLMRLTNMTCLFWKSDLRML